MDQEEFFAHLIGKRSGLLAIGRLGADGRVERKMVPYPLAAPLTDPDWPYFMPALFERGGDEPATRSIAVDVDDNIEVQDDVFVPGLVWQTSKNRFQQAVLLTEEISWAESRILSRRVAPRSDPTEFFRIPGLANTKYRQTYTVEVARAPLTHYSVSAIRKLPDPNGTAVREIPAYEWEPESMGPVEFHRSFESVALNTLCETKSGDFNALLARLVTMDISIEKKVYIARTAECNPFDEAEGRARETAKALVRFMARRDIANPDIAKIIDLRRNQKGPVFIKLQNLSDYVIHYMEERGTFLHTTDDLAYYVERETGRSFYLGVGSEKMKLYLTQNLQINPAATEHRHVKEAIIGHAMYKPGIAETGDIAYFDSDADSLSLYLGGKDVIRLSKHGVDITYNGAESRVFLLPQQFEPMPTQMLDMTSDLSGWWESFFPGMPNVIGMSETQASALLRVWTTFIFFQSAASSRPLLAFLGNYGSGKSSFMTCILRLIYGVRAQLLKVSNANAFDTAIANNLLAFFDNADTTQTWLNEKFATAVARIGDGRRKLFTDNDLYMVTNRALVGFNSRNAPFVQEDVIDRMLYFNLMRFEDMGIPMKKEKDIYSNVTKNRHIFISGLTQDALKVLKSSGSRPLAVTWRMGDFVDIGARIAEALGLLNEFESGLQIVKAQQRGLTLEVDQALLAALETYRDTCRDAHVWKTPSQLWSDFMLVCPEDINMTLKAKYKNATVMSRKMTAIQGILRRVVKIESQRDEDTGFTQWRVLKEA